MKNKNNHLPSQDKKTPEFLNDFKQNGKKRPWDKRNHQTDVFGMAYFKIPGLEKYGEMLLNCGNHMQMMACEEIMHGKKLIGANFCKNRMCVNCQSRRSGVVMDQLFDLAGGHLEKYQSDVPLFLTLTIPNVKGEDIGKTIDRMNAGLRKLMLRKDVKRVVRSSFRAMEITYNSERDDFHPHFHITLLVPPNYFYREDGLYITHENWLRLWQQSMKDDSITQVHIETMSDKGDRSLKSMIAEVAKYVTKPSSLIVMNENGEDEVNPRVLENLHYGIKGRRLIGFGGYFNVLRKEKKLLDVEKAAFEEIEEEEISEDGVVKEKVQKEHYCKICNKPMVREDYTWCRSIRHYVRVYPREKEEFETHLSEFERVQCRGPT